MKLTRFDKIAELHEPINDPLLGQDLGPKGAPNLARTGRRIGRGIGTLEGLATAVAGPVIMGGLGHYVGGLYGGELFDAEHGMLGDPSHHPVSEAMQAAREHAIHSGQTFGAAGGTALGGGVAAHAVLTGQPLRRFLLPAAEAEGLGYIGHGIGKALQHFVPRERTMVERIRQMSPQEGIAFIKNIEASGRERPEVLSAMKDAYNTRRIGIREQLKTNALEPSESPQSTGIKDPLDDPDANVPDTVKDWRHPAGHLGGLVGAGLGALGGVIAPVALGAEIGDWASGGDPSGYQMGGMAGVVPAVPGAAIGGLAGYHAGKAVGKRIGESLETLQPPERHAVEMVRKMHPAESFVHIRNLERSGQASPEVLNAMKETYNFRRRGLGYQLAAGV